METNRIKTKYNYLWGIIAGLWILFSFLYIIKAANESKAYDMIRNNTSPLSSLLTEKLQYMEATIKANTAIQNHEYEKALNLISWTTNVDYYNRGTIETLLAYEHALQNTISWLQTAQIFLAQANHNFQIAKRLNPSATIKKALQNNTTTIESLTPIVEIKTCYTIGNTTINSIKELSNIIQNIETILKEEEIYLQKRAASLNKECKEILESTIKNSKEQVNLLDMQMTYNYHAHLDDFSEKIEEPMICLDTPYENIIPSLEKGKLWLESYQELHENTVNILKNNDKQGIKELCERTKNDAEINQNIESSVQELLQKLNENTREEQEKKKTSQEQHHKDFFTEEKEQTLKEIQKINKEWIENVLNIRGKGNYTAEKYIDDMFNQFYGNSGDFINLHK